ncbi:MAG: FtsW/RodA/SpoVE family cell cycle protein, partial [Gemmatimonadales bacterium]
FAIVGEEFGFVGVFAAIVLFALLLLALIKVAQTAKDSYSCLAVFGFVGMIFTHIFENIGMTVGLMPITGIPLPFFSYGGSFLLVCGIIVGMAMRVHWDSRFGGYGEWGGG